jgi:GTP-binding protein
MLDEELRAFDPELADKPQIRVINKIDILPAERLAALRANAPEGVLFVSALNGEGLDALLAAMWARMGDPEDGSDESDDDGGPTAEQTDDGFIDSDPAHAGDSGDAQ